jgi:PmbA protein
LNAIQIAEQLSDIAGGAIALARAGGAEQAEVGVSHDEGLSVTVRMGELESVERQQDRGLAITVYRNGCKGTASTSDFSDRGVKTVVDKATSIASFTASDPYAGLAAAESMAKDPPNLDLFHPWDIDVVKAEELALIAENAARGFDKRIDNSEGASVSSGAGVRVYANSHGFVGAYPSSSHSMSVSVVAKSNDSLERDYWYTAARSADELEAPEAIGRQAAERAVRRLDSRGLSTRVAPVVFVPELARSLFGHLISAIRGTSQYRKASFLHECAGQQIFPDTITVTEDPHIPRAFASAPFDGEGVTTRKRVLIDKGVVTGYVLSSYSARHLGLETTGNAGGAHNLTVEATAGPLDSIIQTCERVFVVTELLGQGVNTVTGDYSRGAAGFWVEKGEVLHAVSEVTVAGNLRDMYRNMAAVGSDVDIRGTVRCGSILISEMTVAGGGE